jgi:hypothetical protein
VTNTRSLTEDEIVELEAALTTRGTPAPWRVDQDVEGEARDVVGTLPDGETSVVVAECFDEFEADIIVRCRNTLPALLAEVRRLRASPPLAAEPRRDDGATRAGWEACRAQMVAAAKAHADMVGEKGGGSSEGAAAMTAVLWLASLMEKATPAPPLAAEGTAAPDLAAIGGLIDAFEAAVDAFWQPDYEGSDWEVAAARDALDAAIRALAASPAPAQRDAREVVIDCARAVIRDLDTYDEVEHPTARALSVALDALDTNLSAASPSPSGNPGKEPNDV